MIHRLIFAALLFAAGSFVLLPEASAQVAGRNFGVGAQLGDPSGLSLKYYRGGGRGYGNTFSFASYDFLFSWDTGNNVDHFFANVHGLFERPLSDPPIGLYYGPGLFLRLTDRRDDDEVGVGISGNFGVNLFVERFEFFLQLTPRLEIIPDTDGDLGGGIGARFYF